MMTIIEYVTVVSLMSGLQFLLTVALPIGLTLAGGLFLLDYFREIIHRAAVDYLEILARRDAQEQDRTHRELAIVEAGIELRARRLELQGKRLELLDSLSEVNNETF